MSLSRFPFVIYTSKTRLLLLSLNLLFCESCLCVLLALSLNQKVWHSYCIVRFCSPFLLLCVPLISYYLLIVAYSLVKFIPDLLELTLCSSKTIYYSQEIPICLKDTIHRMRTRKNILATLLYMI